ncbi:hypothetical protein KA021_02660 [Candidatus Saccharibacteria bacterium]|jgi:hypothetical protein|nr:hypothetical protein [Candidatus Saccharibacteria bacterium]
MKHKENSISSSQIKKLVVNVMIGSLIGAAAIAVAAVLIGEFNDILGKALITLIVVMIHALASLGFLDSKSKKKNPGELVVFTNTIFVLIVLSFVSSIFGIWELISGTVLTKLYATYFITAFAVSHGEILYKVTGLDKKIDKIIYSNFVLMFVVFALLLPVIWASGAADFPDFYYRLLSAAAIIDTTLTAETKMQSSNKSIETSVDNGQSAAQQIGSKNRRIHPLVIVVGIYLLFQFIIPIMYLIAGTFWM